MSSQYPNIDAWLAARAQHHSHNLSFHSEPEPASPDQPSAAKSGHNDNTHVAPVREAEKEDQECVCKENGNENRDDNHERTVPWPTFPGIPQVTGTTRELKLMPCRRPLALQPGKKWSPAGASRASSYEAALGYCVGRVPDASCGRCIDRLGPFAECVVVPGFFGGVRMGCHWAGCGLLCSFHIKKRTWTGEDDVHYVAKSKKVCGGDKVVRTEVR
jgi:hypothetical protein